MVMVGGNVLVGASLVMSIVAYVYHFSYALSAPKEKEVVSGMSSWGEVKPWDCGS